jgi:hypothetical protein
MLNWRRDPDYERRVMHFEQRKIHYEQRKIQHELRMKRLESEIEQHCFQDASNSNPLPPTEPDSSSS